MKKSYLFITLALLCIGMCLKAQNSGIIYTEFQPDSMLYYNSHTTSTYPRLYLDFDQDNNPDLQFYFNYSGLSAWRWVDLTTNVYDSTWMWNCRISNDWDSPYEAPLSDYEYGKYHLVWRGDWDEQNHFHIDTIMHGAIKYTNDGNCYYGWFLAYTSSTIKYMAVKKMAFCTIPNYPLHWGQTDVIGVEENSEPYAFATIHPNPTLGRVTLSGENLRQAEVVNLLGQQVLSMKGQGNEIHIDMTALPAGIYFVNITDEEGRKCVHKVVKE